MDDEEEKHEPPLEKLPTIDEITLPLTEKEKQQLSILGEITADEAEELANVYPHEIPEIAVKKQTTISRVKEILSIPKKLQRWRHKK